jgi:hypothetical protein
MSNEQTTQGKWTKEDEHKPNYESFQIIEEYAVTTGFKPVNQKRIIAHGVTSRYVDLLLLAPSLLKENQELKVLLDKGMVRELDAQKAYNELKAVNERLIIESAKLIARIEGKEAK